jgi:hypothetical protein
VEADLQRWYHVDYRDRWRGDLTLRRILVLIQHLPPESAVAGIIRGDEMYWPVEAHLLDDLRMTLAAVNTPSNKPKPTPHPQRPRGQRRVRETPERRKKLADARRRAQARRKAIAEGRLT